MPKAEGGRTRAKKDPNAPKKSSSSFVLYCGDHRESVKKQHPELKIQDIQRKLGEMWSKASDAEKKVPGALMHRSSS